jgi:hypothetical protein
MPPGMNGIEKDAAAILQNSELTRATWKDAVRALASDGWKALQAKMTGSQQVEKLVEGAVESADSGVLKLADTAVTALKQKAQTISAGKDGRSEQANALLAEVKSAFEDAGGKIDPASSKAIGKMREIYVDPIEAVKNQARRAVIKEIREQASAVLPVLQEKLENMSTINKTLLTVVGAAVAGAAGVASIYKPSKNGYTLSLPTSVSKQFPMVGRVGLQELSVSNRGLEQLAASIERQIAVKGQPLTVAASYRTALNAAKQQDPSFSLSGKYSFYEPNDKVEAKIRASAERSGRGDQATARASAGIEASRRDPGRFLATSADVTASKTPQQLDLGYKATFEAGKTLGQKQNLDLSAYATVQSESLRSRPDVQTGVKLTQRFGAITWPWESRRAKGNLKLSAALAGKLDGLKSMFKKTGKKLKRKGRRAQAALESAVAPEPQIQLPQIQLPLVQQEKSNMGWWVGGAVAVAAAAGGWWWWKHREG